MSDATPTPPTPEQPAQPATPPAAGAVPPPAAGQVPPAAPTYSAPAYTPGAPVKQTLSLVGFIVGLVAFVFSWAFIFGLLVAVAGLIISILARSREPQAPNWMKLVGLIASIVALVIGVIVLIFWIAVFVAAANSASTY
ncbi:hypothetical protein [Pseudolysinimonas sp.]|uniref:hypothetical protein n=1 Tax=Pseudolysinimonas sp. TaxID=2680009 RepID=UPI003F8167C4